MTYKPKYNSNKKLNAVMVALCRMQMKKAYLNIVSTPTLLAHPLSVQQNNSNYPPSLM